MNTQLARVLFAEYRRRRQEKTGDQHLGLVTPFVLHRFCKEHPDFIRRQKLEAS
ncbi:hypothetical protein CSKR_202258 [Clonorchis sinensis]|uniref:Uncharacterized protein n=1 Tax=Clonorchis sinensis TaxID=79923 RepID=A0A8T1LXL4_CLOSI|nr:hypothetical protein CSKR_202258 [Clonorchis sinensis]